MDRPILWIFSLIVLIGLSNGQNNYSDLEDVIRKVFNISNGTAPVGDRRDSSSNDHGVGGKGGCICVPYYLCSADNKIITDGTIDGFGQIDVRFGQKCTHLDVCCEPDRTRPSTVYLPVTTSTEHPPMTTASKHSHVTTSTEQPPMTTASKHSPVTTSTEHPPVPPKCGVRNVNGVGFRIAGGINGETKFGEFPWMIALLRKNWNPSVHPTLSFCGGSLIHPQVVLTGAHCVHDLTPADITIRAGEWDTQTTNEILPYHERNVINIIKHNRYHVEALLNDIALLILESPLEYADNVGTVCLPQQGVVSTRQDCLVSGWGKTEFAKNASYQVILKKVDLPMVSHYKCQDALRKTDVDKNFILHNSFVCAGGEAGKDACTGDGGGPLVCPVQVNTYEQTGIVSWGVGCGQREVPGVYTNVALFRNWIDQHMNNLGYGTHSYTPS